MMQIT